MMATGKGSTRGIEIATALSTMRSEKVCERLEELLPRLAHELIAKVPENARFAADPDNIEEHHVDWHQYGIITHTKKVREAYHTELAALLDSWRVSHSMIKALSTKDEGAWSRGELLEISIPLHDLGKFQRRHSWQNGVPFPDYVGHENLSKTIVLTNSTVRQTLIDAGLDESDIQRVAELSGLHFELGKVRDVARQHQGYTIAFSKSPEARQIFHDLVAQYPSYALEIGLWYIIDSMGKISLRCDASSDHELLAMRPEREEDLSSHGLRSSLINALMQYPVNMHVAHEYLRVVVPERV
jgi:hypothetical protein